MRPIVSFVNSPTYAISGSLARTLSPVVGNTDNTIKNSGEFADFIRDKTLNACEELVSFDVVSLFTKAVFFCKKGNSALSEHTCLTNHAIGLNKSKIITTNRRHHQRLCLEAWHINSAHAPLNRNDGGLLPDAYLHLVRKKAAK